MFALMRTDNPNVYFNLADISTITTSLDVSGDIKFTIRTTGAEDHVITSASLDYATLLRDFKYAASQVGSKFEYKP